VATLYARKNRWWVAWYENGGRRQTSTGLLLEDKAKAEAVKRRIEEELAKCAALGEKSPGTVGAWRKTWLKQRATDGVASVKDDAARLKHARELDSLRLEEVTPKHIRELVLRLKREGRLAPRTVRHVYSTLSLMFRDAVIEGHLRATPCVLRRGDLPAKKDADPTWRDGAVFSRAEVEQLLSDARVPEERRALYAVLFCGGLRIGEVAALRWRHYEPDLQPLGKLLVALSYNRKTATVKGVKVEGRTRQVPVHPVLAAALASWRLGGWERYVGHAPQAEDLLLPNYRGAHLRDPVVHANLLRDLEALGLRARRVHDARRTFISLAMADGARKDVLRWVTHGPSGDVVDAYTTLPWTALCAEVGKLHLTPRHLNGRVLEFATP
jgi:integrase